MSEFEVKNYSIPSPNDILSLPAKGSTFGLNLSMTRGAAIQMINGWLKLGLLNKDDLIAALEPEFKVFVADKGLPTKSHELDAAISEALRLSIKEQSDASVVIEHSRIKYEQPKPATANVIKL